AAARPATDALGIENHDPPVRPKHRQSARRGKPGESGAEHRGVGTLLPLENPRRWQRRQQRRPATCVVGDRQTARAHKSSYRGHSWHVTDDARGSPAWGRRLAGPACGAGASALGGAARRWPARRRPHAGWCVATATILLLSALSVGAQEKKPLLMDGRKSLYQRVLTRPGAELTGQPGGTGGKPLPAFSQLYVYERRPLSGVEWLAVGPGSRGTVDGWLRADTTLPWASQMALAFTNPAGRERTLLLDKRETVLELL